MFALDSCAIVSSQDLESSLSESESSSSLIGVASDFDPVASEECELSVS